MAKNRSFAADSKTASLLVSVTDSLDCDSELVTSSSFAFDMVVNGKVSLDCDAGENKDRPKRLSLNSETFERDRNALSTYGEESVEKYLEMEGGCPEPRSAVVAGDGCSCGAVDGGGG